MRQIVNHLIQLQELILIRDEAKLHATGHLEQLNEYVREMAAKLPAEVHASFDKLHKKDRMIIVPISENGCVACGMKLPISLIQAVRLEREIHGCPNCARMLYYPESAPKRIGKPARRTERQKVGISRFSSQTLMVPKIDGDTPEAVIRGLAEKMETEGFVEGGEKLVEAALRRETILSTAVGHGLAFPHVRGVEGGGLTLALGLISKPIKWDMTETEKSQVRIVFFMVIPTAASAFYLKLLSGLTESFMKPEARKAIMAEKDEEGLWKALCKLTRSVIK